MTQKEQHNIIRRLQNQIRFANRKTPFSESWRLALNELNGMINLLAGLDIWVSCDVTSTISKATILFPGDTRPLTFYRRERDES